MARPAALAVALAILLSIAGCGLPGIPAPAAEPTAGPFTDVAALAGAMRARQLSDRTVSFTNRLTYDSGTQGYSGEGALVVIEGATDERFRVPLADGRTVELVTIGSDAFISGTELAGSEVPGRPWRRSSFDEAMRGSPELFFAIVLTQLDSIDEAFVLRGSSAEVRGATRVTEYRMAADYLETFELTRRHLGVETSPSEYTPEQPIEMGLTLAVDSDFRLVEAQFDIVDGENQLEHAYEFSRWGEPVDVTAPPPDLVAVG